MRHHFYTYFFLFLTGCATVQPVVERTDTITVTEVLRDTSIVVEPDSAVIRAWFECDSLNQVVMFALEAERGRKTMPVVRWKDKILTVTAAVDSEQVYVSWKERHEKIVSQQVVFQAVEAKDKPPWWLATKWVIRWVNIAGFLFLLSFYLRKR